MTMWKTASDNRLSRMDLDWFSIFCLGINNGLRAGDLVSIKVGTVRNAKIDESINIIEQKTGKPNILVVNRVCHRILHEYLNKVPLRDSDYLFPSQKAYARKDEGKPKARDRKLDTRSVNALVKKWCQEAGIRGHFGSHTLRKTFGYIQYKEFNVDLSVLCKRFNHSSPAITLRYIGIDREQVRSMLTHEI